jgi:hypothetical protein
MRISYIATSLVLLTSLAACSEWDLDTRWRSESFRVIAIDSPGQMSLIDTRSGSAAIVGPTIYAVGANDTFVVVIQHPALDDFGKFDRTVSNYFVVARDPAAVPRVRGPLAKPDFVRLSHELALPAIEKTFQELM